MEVAQCINDAMWRPDDDDEERDAERATHLTRCLVHGAADRKALLVQARDRGGTQYREGEPDAQTGDERSRQPVQQVVVVEADARRVPDESGNEHCESNEQDSAKADTRRGLAGGSGY